MEFTLIDTIVFCAYALMIVGLGLWVSRDEKGHQKTAEDYFLAGKSLPWWAIGASLIAANISAEQIIGMSGSGFAVGLAIASYEWMAAVTLIIVGKYLLPIFIEKEIFTIPEFVEKRFNTTLKTILAVFWIALFVFVNLTTVLYLGALALDTIMGTGDGSMMMYALIGLSAIAAAYSLYGGLSAVAWTDVIQVGLLVLGGFVVTFAGLYNLTPEGGLLNGITHLYDVAGDKFDMILDQSNPEFSNLPGIAVLIGGMWVANLYYWGFNQYIIQRTLAAKSLKESQKGIIFAGFLKLIIPLIVVIPGIIVYALFTQPEGTTQISGVVDVFTKSDGSIQYDNAYPWLMKVFLSPGFLGLVVAALAAAIVSSMASMLNSVATIFTMDIYIPYFNKDATDKQTVNMGRISASVALLTAIIVAPQLDNVPQVFQYIQEYTGMVSPGILAVFLMGLFWKKTTSKGAIYGVLSSIVIAVFLKTPAVQLPFLDQMLYTLILTIVIIMGVSLTTNPHDEDPKAIHTTSEMFKTSPAFNIGAYIILVIVAVLYAVFW
ncbi:sodium/glucose cotransporter [Aliifodinibius salipaludis]|uniref:Sodium/glucose cotransporter n=1 Tax=Fodinibius salipaludis TaxID=2032627 RepID=A0A2A2GF79_9BACT|nr:sodium/sugar symporter [Aliifodinibius salipaludis]PAU95587.1 sodium/glucose cotransporter [Aliifodinibius salipaludis]